MSSEEKIRRTNAAVKKAKKEILKLTVHMKKGTLHQKRLDSGLKNLTKAVFDIPNHKLLGPSG
jgi:ribosomal protein L17